MLIILLFILIFLAPSVYIYILSLNLQPFVYSASFLILTISIPQFFRKTSKIGMLIQMGGSLSYVFFIIFQSFSFYLQGEGVNEIALFNLRKDVIQYGFFNYPLLTIPALVLIVLIVYLNKKVFVSLKIYNLKLYIVFTLISLPLLVLFGPWKELKLINHYLLNNFEHKEVVNKKPSEQVEIYSSKNKNLIWIYLESLEANYFNEDVFPGLLPNLQKLKARGVSLENFRPKLKASITITALYASQCGEYLERNSNSILVSGYDEELVCLSDILNKAGYDQVFIGGADRRFAGKSDFLFSHKYDEVYGYREIAQATDQQLRFHSWGLYDQDMLGFAYQKVKKLVDNKAPFNLTLLTLDTHHPNGYVSATCPEYKQIKSNTILQSVHCTDYLIGKFIKKLEKENILENSLLFLMSDHLALRNTATSFLKKVKPRKLTGIFLGNIVGAVSQNAPVYHTDLTSSILDILGIRHSHKFENSYTILNRNNAKIHPSLLKEHEKQEKQINVHKNAKLIGNFQTDIKNQRLVVKINNKNFYIYKNGFPSNLRSNELYAMAVDEHFDITSSKIRSYQELVGLFSRTDPTPYLLVIGRTKDLNLASAVNSEPRDSQKWVLALINKKSFSSSLVKYAQKFQELSMTFREIKKVLSVSEKTTNTIVDADDLSRHNEHIDYIEAWNLIMHHK